MIVVDSENKQHYPVELLEVVRKVADELQLTKRLHEAQQKLVAFLRIVVADGLIQLKKVKVVFPNGRVFGLVQENR